MLKLIISSVLMMTPFIMFAAGADAQAETKFHGKQIHTQELKTWYANQKPMVILDARSKPYFDGSLLPNAKWMAFDVVETELQGAIPSKDSVVVVYCAGPGCPASDWLAARLVDLGYSNVYEYQEGITGWVKDGNPTQTKI